MSDDKPDTVILPPPPERPDYAKWSIPELLAELLNRFDAFEGWKIDVDRRLASIDSEISAIKTEVAGMKSRLEQGDGEFRTLDANIGLLVNATQAICLERGIDDHVDQLGDAITEWQARLDRKRNNGASVHEVPTNRDNAKPSEPPEPNAETE